MTSRRLGRVFLALALVFLGVGTGAAQTSTGGLRGFVRDGTGGVLAGVTVEATSPARIGAPAVTVTDEQGLYSFTNLPLGEYTLRFELPASGRCSARASASRSAAPSRWTSASKSGPSSRP